MRKITCHLIFAILSSLFQLSAQSYQLKKDIDYQEIEKLIDEMNYPAKADLTFNIDLASLKGEPYRNESFFRKELAKIQQKIKQNPENSKNYGDYANTYKVLYPNDTAVYYKSLREALQKKKKELQSRPNKGESYFYLSELSQGLGMQTEALQAMEKAATLIPDSSKVWVKKGIWVLNEGKFEEAKEFFKKGITVNERDLEAHLFYCYADLYIGFARLNSDPSYRISLDYSLLNQTKKRFPAYNSFELLSKSLELTELFYQFMMKAATLLTEKPDAKPAMIFEQVEQKDANLPVLEKYFIEQIKKRKGDNSLLYSALGIISMLNKKKDEAKEFFEQSIRENPDKTVDYYNLVFVNALTENWSGAEMALKNKQSMKESAQDVAILCAIYKKAKKNSEFEQTIQKALSNYPNSSLLLFFSALYTAQENKSFPRAMELTEQSLDKDKSDSDVLFLYGLLALRTGKLQVALDVLYVASYERNHQKAKKLFEDYFEKK